MGGQGPSAYRRQGLRTVRREFGAGDQVHSEVAAGRAKPAASSLATPIQAMTDAAQDSASRENAMMEDFKSSFRSMIPYLARNFIRYFPGDQIRGLMLRRMLAELKVTASRISPIQLYDIPGLAGVSVISTLHGGAVVALLAKARRARFIFEFGTYTGATTMEIALNCPDAE